ncbi:glycosyltransferase family 4 protein [Rugosimonospora acidiphila]|uniref:Glycosyltransferase family 4 protein n=1 Tax=Rugosimonospora acidiphila TaxID=556531 RepID=A0ABP9RS35_9ACTN
MAAADLTPAPGGPTDADAPPDEAVPLAGRSVALVHEWFAATGGSENVFVAMGEALPHAKRYVLWREPDAERGRGFQESWLARTPLRRAKPLALPVMPVVWRTLTRERFEVVISSSHALAHTVKLPGADTRYLSYVHSPARYVWSPDYDARGSGGLLTLPRKALQVADRRLSRHVHSYAANSREVRERIRRFWGRDARIINPPVDVAYFAAAPPALRAQERRYLLGVGRWIPYKNFDLMIEIAEAARTPLVIAGSGPQHAALRRTADKVRTPVTFVHRPSRERLRELYWGARALLFPTHEDFGIIPVEAQACGAPVLGMRRGGLLETVVDDETGVLLGDQDPTGYAAALPRVDGLDRERVAAHAWGFSAEVFRTGLTAWLHDDAT